MRERLRRTLGGAGRTLITAGLLILGFVAYQLWGTGVITAREQRHLKNEFATELARARTATTSTTTPPTTSAPTTSTSTTTTPSSPVVSAARVPAVHDGDVIGIIHLPWSSYAIVEGTTRNDLEKGPGHYPATVFPGELGNAAIAGHRTTYLHPFYDADTLHVGSEIQIDMLWGRYTYRVTREPYPVSPSDVSVVATHDPGAATLTLTTCNPKYSARQRLVVDATLVVAKSPAPKPYVAHAPPKALQGSDDAGSQARASAIAASLENGLSGDTASRTPTLLWGVFAFLVGLLWWWVYRHWRHPFTWFAGLVPFLPVLFAFYLYLERVLPAGF
jgi:sortase A